MGNGVIVIKKQFQGEEWVNTHPFSVNGDGSLTNDDLVAIGMDRDLSNAGTTPGNIAFGDGVGPVPLLYAVLGWERLMHFDQIQFTAVYVTDKLENSAVTDLGANTFAVKPLGFNGLRGTAASIAPGNITAMVNRVPAVFSRRAGRMYLRGCLYMQAVAFLGRGLLGWANNDARNDFETLLTNSVNSSGLNAFFQGGLGLGEVGIGRYRRGLQVPPLDEGDLYEVVQIEGLRSMGPVSRQVKRGRARS